MMSTIEQKRDHWPAWACETVLLAEPDPTWLLQGASEIRDLGTLLSPFGVVEIEHIGSTSVPGLAAKPVLDLMARIRSWENLAFVTEILALYGWRHVSPKLDGRPWRQFFVKAVNNRRTAHLHMMLPDEPRWHEQLQFRDALRQSCELAEQYAQLKRELCARYADDREAYTEAKTEFIYQALGGVSSTRTGA